MAKIKPCVYILASRYKGTLYIGVTANMMERVYQHKSDLLEGFTKKYNVHKLVHYEFYEDMSTAILREKRIKKWRRTWKQELIEEHNPTWRDLYYDLA